jgi:hypothetical protein
MAKVIMQQLKMEKLHTTTAFVKAWLTSRTCAVVILIIFCSSRQCAIEPLFLSSTLVFN